MTGKKPDRVEERKQILSKKKESKLILPKEKKVEQSPSKDLQTLITNLNIPGEWIQHSPGTWRRKRASGNN